MNGSSPKDEAYFGLSSLTIQPIPDCHFSQTGRSCAVIKGYGRHAVQHDIFGNLSRKDGVLVALEEIACQNRLDEHQIGLARILRSKENHTLLHAALECATKIERSSDILIAEALNVLVAQDLPVSIRSLAAGALGHLISRRPTQADSDFDLDRVTESMAHVLRKSESPALKKALLKAIGLARSRRPRNGPKPPLQMKRARG